MPASPAWKPGHGRLDRRQVEQVEQLGLVDRAREAGVVEDLGEVHDGPGQAGYGDAVDERAVVVVEHSASSEL